jgi:fluoride ion exporter CrcB/FEX
MTTKEKEYGFLRANALTLAFSAVFLLTLVGQAISGVADFNAQQIANGLEPVSLGAYVTSSSFGVDVMENWQSEYLQFFLYIFGTVYLVQKGSSESKKPGEEGKESDKEQKIGRYAEENSPAWARVGGWRTSLFSRSLGLVMLALFLLTWTSSSVAGWAAFNSEQLGQRQDPVSWVGYLGEADFWNRSFQNWQSEMLAVGSMAIFSVFLRQRGSPESKPVGVPHEVTGQTG